MTDAWGGAWGTPTSAWGVSWGTGATPVTPSVTSSGTSYNLKTLSRKRREELALASERRIMRRIKQGAPKTEFGPLIALLAGMVEQKIEPIAMNGDIDTAKAMNEALHMAEQALYQTWRKAIRQAMDDEEAALLLLY